MADEIQASLRQNMLQYFKGHPFPSATSPLIVLDTLQTLNTDQRTLIGGLVEGEGGEWMQARAALLQTKPSQEDAAYQARQRERLGQLLHARVPDLKETGNVFSPPRPPMEYDTTAPRKTVIKSRSFIDPIMDAFISAISINTPTAKLSIRAAKTSGKEVCDAFIKEQLSKFPMFSPTNEETSSSPVQNMQSPLFSRLNRTPAPKYNTTSPDPLDLLRSASSSSIATPSSSPLVQTRAFVPNKRNAEMFPTNQPSAKRQKSNQGLNIAVKPRRQTTQLDSTSPDMPDMISDDDIVFVKTIKSPNSKRAKTSEPSIASLSLASSPVKEHMDVDMDLTSQDPLGLGVSIPGSPTTNKVRPVDTPQSFNPRAGRKSMIPIAQKGGSSSLDEFQDLVEEIFSAEDDLESGAGPSTQQRHFDNQASSNATLTTASMHSLLSLLTKISKSASDSSQFPLKLEVSKFARLLKLLDRGVTLAGEVRPISADKLKVMNDAQNGISTEPKAKKGKKAKKPAKSPKAKRTAVDSESDDDMDDSYGSRSKVVRNHQNANRRSSRSRSNSASAQSPEEEFEESQASENRHWSDSELDKLANDIAIVSAGLLAASTAMAVLSAGKLPKLLYSEDAINNCVRLLRENMDTLVLPLTKAFGSKDSGILSAALANKQVNVAATDLLSIVCTTFAKLNALITAETMAESIIITSVYIALGPFLAELPLPTTNTQRTTKGKSKSTISLAESTLKVFRGSSLVILRNISSRYPDQRKWIIEELLFSIRQVTDFKSKIYRLSNGKCIHALSALFLHIVQTPAHNILPQIGRFARDQPASEGQGHSPESATESLLAFCQTSIGGAIDASAGDASLIVSFLFAKSKVAPREVASYDYKSVLETFVNDTLAVYDLLEWPVAHTVLRVVVAQAFNVLAESKSSADVNALKLLALEHLGSIGAHLSRLGAQSKAADDKPGFSLMAIAEKDSNSCFLGPLVDAHHSAISALAEHADEDGSYEDAVSFLAVQWGHEVVKALLRGSEEAESLVLGPTYDTIRAELVWLVNLKENVQRSRVYHSKNETTRPDGGDFAKVKWVQYQESIFHTLLNRLLHILQTADAANMRAKALRALNAIVAENPDIFGLTSVRLAIEQRFRDSQTSVRDAAFDLLGEYVVHRPDLARDYLPQILERSTDTGLSVRKRVIKLLRRLYVTVAEPELKSAICLRVLWRTRDEDTSIKESAVQALDEIFFGSVSQRKSATKDSHLAEMFTAIIAMSPDRQVPLQEALTLIIERKGIDSKSVAQIELYLGQAIECLVQKLVDSQDSKTSRVLCVRLIDILIQIAPKLFTSSHGTLLLPFLQSTDTPDESIVREHLFRIFRNGMPNLPSATVLAQRLQTTLQELLSRAPPSLTTIQELVACLCYVMIHHTQQIGKLAALFGAINKKLNQQLEHYRQLADSLSGHDQRSIVTVIYLLALLCQHSNFDSLRLSDDAAAAEIDNLTTASVSATTFNRLVQIYNDPVCARLQFAVLNALGFLFQAYPMLMLRPEATQIMDKVFLSQSMDHKLRILTVIQDFLKHQAAKASQEAEPASPVRSRKIVQAPKAVDIGDLIGNNDDFADSGVGSSIVQRYLRDVLKAALCDNNSARWSALEIISYTVRQGLAHPSDCLPVVICLETNADPKVAQRAFGLHTLLHTKHSAMVHTRFFECAKQAFLYQSELSGDNSPESRKNSDKPTATLAAWYGLLKDKRQWRLDFVKSMTRAFSVDLSQPATFTNVRLACYIADNLAALDYKTVEEIVRVIQLVDQKTTEGGMQVIQLTEERLSAQDVAMGDSQQTTFLAPTQNIENVDLQSLTNASLVLSAGLLLKNFLMTTFKIDKAKLAKATASDKKSAAGDKQPVRAANVAASLDFSQFPLLESATTPPYPIEACKLQAILFQEKLDIETTVGASDNETE